MKITIHDLILIALAVGTVLGCKKEALPALPVINKYRMDIEITDNSPFGNVGSIFILGRENYLQDKSFGADTGNDFIYGSNHPVYVQRSISYADFDSIQAYATIGTNLVYDNWYNVRTYKNDTLVHQVAGYVLDIKTQIN